MGKIIKAEKVGYIYQSKYQKTKTLTEVSCSFERGRVYAITGKSGSGKSTFLSLLAGLDVPTEGTLYIDGRDIREIDRDAYRMNQASVIYQAFHLFPLLAVLENVMFPMQLQHISKSEAQTRAREFLAKVGLLCKLAHEENYAVIVVTHNENVAEAADMVYGMLDGVLKVVRG